MFNAEKILSAKIRRLATHINSGNYEELDNFWLEIKDQGSPLIEKIQNNTNDVLITFIYKATNDINNVVIYGAFPSYRYNENTMEYLPNSDLWFKTYKVRNDIKFSYNYSINDSLDDDYKKRSENLTLDELNPKKIIFINDENEEVKRSLVELDNVEPYKWINFKENSNKGTINLYKFNSETLNNSKKIWIYTPYNYDVNKTYNLIVLTDGFDHINILNSKNVLDNLIHDMLISESICVFIDNSVNRYEELTCNDDFCKFLADELILWIHKNYKITTDPNKTTIGGFSLGGLAAAYIGLKYNNIFGNVLAQSGSFWWNNEWLIDLYKNSKPLSLKFYLNVGLLEDRPYDDEPIMKECIDKMRSVLLSKGYKVTYEQFPSGHDYLFWGEKLATGLIALTLQEL